MNGKEGANHTKSKRTNAKASTAPSTTTTRGDRHRQLRQTDNQAIKEFAETTMNELLGLYGYGKVDSRDTLGLSLHRFTNHSPPPHPPSSQAANSSPLRAANQSPPISANDSPPPHHPSSDHEHDGDSLDSDGVPVPGPVENSLRSLSPGKTDQGSGSSRGSTPKSENGGVPGGGVSGVVLCSWCGRVCSSGGRRGTSAFQLPTTSGDRHFCSEVCFTQCRRASFKKSKVCDWCRHVRPTVTYVDFTDGDHQLQFCSDKCLNQYKMQIFCRETEAHLQMHPHLNDLKPASATGLITPDLWLRDCAQNSEPDSGPDADIQVESPSSPPPSTPPSTTSEPSEPVNLTTQPSTRNESHRSSPIPQRPPAPSRHGSSRPSEVLSPGPPPAPRYGRPRLRDRREGVKDSGRPRTVRTSLQLARSSSQDCEKSSDTVRLPAIRVRHLEAQQQQEKVVGDHEFPSSSAVIGDSTSDVPSPHPSSQPPPLSLGGLSGGLSGLLPMVGGAPLLLPHMIPPDLPRTPLLPHLLLQHSDLLRPPPLRHPVLPAPAPAPPTPAPPTVPPPPPGPPKTPGSLLPPVTVLIPCPLPIPVPIPIPLPIPIPVSTNPDAHESKTANAPAKDTAVRPRVSSRKEGNRPGFVAAGPVGASSSTSSGPPPCPIPVQPHPPPPPPTTSSSSCDSERNAPSKPDRERRSILRYTSDVYEINGMFLPKDSAWEAPEPLQLRRALVGDSGHGSPYDHHSDFDSRGVSHSPSPEPTDDNKESLAILTRNRDDDNSTSKQLLVDEEDDNIGDAGKLRSSSPASTASPTVSPSTSNKRHATTDHPQQPLPKKKHLLV